MSALAKLRLPALAKLRFGGGAAGADTQTDGWQTGEAQGRVEVCAAATASMNPTALIL